MTVDELVSAYRGRSRSIRGLRLVDSRGRTLLDGDLSGLGPCRRRRIASIRTDALMDGRGQQMKFTSVLVAALEDA